MASVFVSYAREDAAKARIVARELEAASFDVWFDERIHSGSEFSREIEEALSGAAAVVVLWSAQSVKSPWVRDEAAEGRDSGRLVSVLLDDSRPPIGFRQFQATDMSRWSGRSRPKQIGDVVAAVLAKTGASPMVGTKQVATVRHWSKQPFALAASAVIVLAAAGAVLMTSGTSKQSRAVSVALMPFEADSSNAEAHSLASATHDALAHTLSQGAFALTALDAGSRTDHPSADFVITGELSTTPNKVIASVRMEETAHHVVVFSHQFETTRDKAYALPEQVGGQVAAQLSWTAPMIAIERRHPSDPAITGWVLQMASAGLQGGNLLRDYQNAQRLAQEAPNSPVAQNNLAFATAFVLDELPREQRQDAVSAALRAADRTIALAPEFGDAYVPWCMLHSEQRRIECEDHIRAGMRADPDSPFASFFLSELILHQVGRNREASAFLKLSLAHDQYMPAKIASAVRIFEVTGQTADAADVYRQSTSWWPQNEEIISHRERGLAERGDLVALLRFQNEVGGDQKPGAVLVAINRKSLPTTRAACAGAKDFDATLCLVALAQLGDLNDAFALADRLYPSRRGRTSNDEERIWLDDPDAASVSILTAPAAAPLRRDPRYLAIADRVGLLEYWRSGRLPDFCDLPRPEPICAQFHARS